MDFFDEIIEQDEIIERYAELKKLADEYASRAKELNEIIKQKMLKDEITDYTTTNGIKIHLTEQSNDKLNESGLIEYLTHITIEKGELDKIVKTKPYIDTDGLENAIYTKIISAESVDAFIEHKTPIYKLTVKKGK